MNKKSMDFCQKGPSPLKFIGKKARARRKARRAARKQTNESVAENKANAPKANDAHEKATYIYNRKKEMGLI
mgnify:CR=1 FL=1